MSGSIYDDHHGNQEKSEAMLPFAIVRVPIKNMSST
jgi:hypothetical protein